MKKVIKMNKRSWLKFALIKLAFGILIFSCAHGYNNGGIDPALNGIWVGTSGNELKFNNGNLDVTVNGEPWTKQTYTTKSGEITQITTHVLGSNYKLEPRLYSKNELETALNNIDASNEVISNALERFNPRISIYYINNNTLYMGDFSYVKK